MATKSQFEDVYNLERIQRLATRLTNGLRNFPYEERLQGLGPHPQQRGRVQAHLIIALKIKVRLLHPKLVFLPPTCGALRGHPSR